MSWTMNMGNARIGCDCMLENVFNVFQLKRRPFDIFIKYQKSKSLPLLRMVSAHVPPGVHFAVAVTAAAAASI